MPVALTVPGLLVLALVGAAAARLAVTRIVVYGGSLVFCAGLLAAGVNALTAPVAHLVLPIGLPWIGLQLRVDALAGFFLALIGLGGAGASLFALGYARHEHHPERVLPFYPAFLAGMALVVIADDAFSFLFAWELMSLTSWALVLAHHKEAGNTGAGFVYLIMATFSGMALLLAFGLLAGPQGAYAFDAMRAHPPTTAIAATVLVVTLIGAGSKAGLVPLHVWLPQAHPAAPSHVSALMSGVMTKVAIYGFIRIVFDLLGPTEWWSGTVVLALGGATAVLGVLHAVMERDLKRLLAYSTVENIGIVFIGLGLALAFRANGFTAGAALALTAALFHALNHTLFKSLLFFGAGAVLDATGQRDMETLGGLIHRMPRTAVAVLVGCAAIAALPPLNGFASEWLTFQAVLLHPDLPQWGLKLMIPVDGAALALAAALAASCFVRAYGICFLGRPRSQAAAQAREADFWSVAAMAGFAGLCLLTGVFPGAVIDTLAPVVQTLTTARMPVQLSNTWLTIAPVAASRSSYNGLLVFGFIAVSMILTLLAVSRLSTRGVRRAPPWDCGFPDPTPLSQYSAGSFAQPIRRVFATVLFRAKDTVTMPPPGDSRPATITHHITDPVWDGVYAPLGRAVLWIAEKANVLQFLTIRRYLGFVFGALVVLLMALTIWQ
ncbi:hydrogenase 4 subunit B [Rhodopila globiformis]|uniref:Hydrogenase 4 subunit B n=2 Tax=Rhodopila globiformis TaxID=1071 RepID=A0A2S6N713_RHOGL|nr:hydrogenase 4 subunit B [Rhodopila globiformis]